MLIERVGWYGERQIGLHKQKLRHKQGSQVGKYRVLHV
jgi:predicted RNA binding protein YcfA (HicA-like mRNA interferase family)